MAPSTGPNTLALVTQANQVTRPPNVYDSSLGFSPMTPIPTIPIDGTGEPRYQEYQPGFNLPADPGTGKMVSFALLKQASRVCVPLRRALEVRKQELSTQAWDIRIKQQYAKTVKLEDVADIRAALVTFFGRPNKYEKESFGDWIREAEENVATLDAFAVYFRRTLGPRAGVLQSGLAALDIIDGATIKPIIDIRGGTPQPPAAAYNQYLYGAPRTEFMAPDVEDNDNPVVARMNAQQLYYRKFNRIPGQIYGFSNVETALMFVKLWLGRMRYHTNYFDESSMPAGFMSMPPDYNLGQINAFERDLNRVLSADSAWRWRLKAVPNGAKFQEIKPPQYAMDFDDWIVTQLASCMDVTAEELGITPRHGLGGKGWSEAAGQRQIRLAILPRLTFFAEFFNYLIEAVFGIQELEFAFLDPDDTDALEQAQTNGADVNNGIRTRNEVREERGYDKSTDPMADSLTVTTPQGLTTLAQANEVTEATIAKLQAPPPTPMIAPPAAAAPAAQKGADTPPPPKPEPAAANKDVTADSPAGGLNPYDLAGTGKVSKASVHYTAAATGANQCQRCAHFQGDQICAIVDGAISPGGWCERYSEDSLKIALRELGAWERYVSRPWARTRAFATKAVHPDIVHAVTDLLGRQHEGLTDPEYQRLVFREARNAITKTDFFTDEDGEVHPIAGSEGYDSAKAGGGKDKGGSGGKESMTPKDTSPAKPGYHDKETKHLSASEWEQYLKDSAQGQAHVEVTDKGTIAKQGPAPAAKVETSLPSYHGKDPADMSNDEVKSAQTAWDSGGLLKGDDSKFYASGHEPAGQTYVDHVGAVYQGGEGGKALSSTGSAKGEDPTDKEIAGEKQAMGQAHDASQNAEDTKAGKADSGKLTNAGMGRAPKSAADWNKSLTSDQADAVRHWSGTSYTAIRDVAKGQTTATNAVKVHDNFVAALKTAPTYNGEVHRGIRNISTEDFEKMTGTKIMHMSSPASFSKDKSVALSFSSGTSVGKHSVTFQVEAGHKGADISQLSHYQNEKEVVMPKGHSFQVTHTEIHDRATDQGGKYAIIHMKPLGMNKGEGHL